MYEWELASWARSRQFHGTERAAEHWAETGAAHALIQATYLGPKRRVYAAQPTFQRPPAYDPSKERIVSSSVEGKNAVVETTRASVLGSGQYQYTLHLHPSGWLIDSAKWFSQGSWQRVVL